MIAITNYEAANWAAQFVKIGATIDVVNRELICCNVADESANAVRSEFFKLAYDSIGENVT